jgi:nucleotide-binding universal stress UspA family protein
VQYSADKEERLLKLDTILVPVDGSALAESAITTAVEIARPGASTIILMRAAEARTLPGVDPTEAQVQVVGEAERYLAGVVERLARQGVANVETSVWYEPAAAAIIDAARLRKADLIVMTTHGRSGVGRLILGSVAESVLRGTTVPVLLLRAPKAPIEPPAGMAQAWPVKVPPDV